MALGVRRTKMSFLRLPLLLALVLCLTASSWQIAGAATPRPCTPRVEQGVLPVWARGGFSSPRPRLPHVVGMQGKIAALVFGYPLLSPPGASRSNKILWVLRSPLAPLSDLRITAQRMQGVRPIGPPVLRTVRGGPGPSIVDLRSPDAGASCCDGQGTPTRSICSTAGTADPLRTE
jgi:hypothetical protein